VRACVYKAVLFVNKKRLIQYDRNLLMLINNYSKHHSLYELSHNINLMTEYKIFTIQTVVSVQKNNNVSTDNFDSHVSAGNCTLIDIFTKS